MLNLDVSYRTLKIDYNTKAFLKNSFVHKVSFAEFDFVSSFKAICYCTSYLRLKKFNFIKNKIIPKYPNSQMPLKFIWKMHKPTIPQALS